jgi:hypothetical protein
MALARGRGKRGGVRFYLMLSLASQAAQTPEFAKVFCFLSSEKNTFLASPLRKVRRILVRAMTLLCRLVDKRERLLLFQV